MALDRTAVSTLDRTACTAILSVIDVSRKTSTTATSIVVSAMMAAHLTKTDPAIRRSRPESAERLMEFPRLPDHIRLSASTPMVIAPITAPESGSLRLMEIWAWYIWLDSSNSMALKCTAPAPLP